jgi:aminopeptidase
MNVKGGLKMNKEQLIKLGSNYSKVHCDFMFGSEDMNIIGIDHEDKQFQIMENGKFKF